MPSSSGLGLGFGRRSAYGKGVLTSSPSATPSLFSAEPDAEEPVVRVAVAKPWFTSLRENLDAPRPAAFAELAR